MADHRSGRHGFLNMTSGRPFCFCLAAWIVLFSVPVLSAPQPEKRPCGSEVHDVIKTSWGGVFIATDKGISQVVGPDKYINYTVYNGLVSGMVYDLETDDAGKLWIASEGGISVFKDGEFVNFPYGEGFIEGPVIRLEFRGGKIKGRTSRGDVLIFEGRRVKYIPGSPQKERGRYNEPSFTREDIGSNNDISRWREILDSGKPALYPYNLAAPFLNIKPSENKVKELSVGHLKKARQKRVRIRKSREPEKSYAGTPAVILLIVLLGGWGIFRTYKYIELRRAFRQGALFNQPREK